MTGHPAASADVLVIGAGPAGSAAARVVAAAGRRVVAIDLDDDRDTDRLAAPTSRRASPVTALAAPGRAASGAALLTPAAVATVTRVGLDHLLDGGHRVEQVRLSTTDHATTTTWPSHGELPGHAVVVDRRRFDLALGRVVAESGADIWFGHEATAPIVERGFVRGAYVTAPSGERFEARADYVVVADGANSRFGRALGSFRDPSYPYALAHHAEYGSAIHDATEIEIVVGLRDRAGTPITGYGWMFPTGRGTVDVGVLLISTSPSFQVLNPAHVLDRFVDEHRGRWHLRASGPVVSGGGRIPLGRSVGPAAGPTWLLAGDAAGVADPWSGAGLGPALITGSIAGDVIVEALASGSATSLQRYPRLLDEQFEPSYRVGRLADQVFGRPSIANQAASRAARSRTVADGFLRLATGAVRPGHLGPAEITFRIARTLGVILPGI